MSGWAAFNADFASEQKSVASFVVENVRLGKIGVFVGKEDVLVSIYSVVGFNHPLSC
jgi:hypothetical protein